MNDHIPREIAQLAAQLVVDQGLDIAEARRQAARQLGGRSVRSSDLPRNEDVEAAVREQHALFHPEQPQELRLLRELALRWMQRLAAHRPHLAGAVWRGLANRRSAVRIDLYCDDAKMAEIDLLNQGLDFDTDELPTERGRVTVATLADRVPGWTEPVTLHLFLHDLDDLKGALKPDAHGQTWRGDHAALQRRLQESPA